MKKVLLIGPYNPEIRTGQFLAPPLGIYRIASYLENKGVAHVDVIDPNLDYDKLYNKLDSTQYDLIGHSILHPTFKEDLKLIFNVNDKQPEALKVVGGQGASFNYKELLIKTPIKIVVRGFGEKQLENILMTDGDFSDISGLYLEREGKPYSTKLLDKLIEEEFRTISRINFRNLPYERYWKYITNQYSEEHLKVMRNEGMLKTIRLITSNYCPMGCTFCSSTNFLNEGSKSIQKFLQLPANDIINLMKEAVKSHPETEAFYFNDDNFMLNRERVEKFCELAKGLDKQYNLMCMGRVDNVDYDILNKMKNVGFKTIFYGVETFSNTLARDLKKTKNNDYEQTARRAMLDTLSVGLVPQISLILFLPSSTIQDLETTIDNTVDLLEQGARVTLFPYVEAFSGAEITNNHKISYNEFEIQGHKFSLPHHILLDDQNLNKLAGESIELKKKINKKFRDKYCEIIPQPIDSLNLFLAVYRLLGKPTTKIEKIISELV